MPAENRKRKKEQKGCCHLAKKEQRPPGRPSVRPGRSFDENCVLANRRANGRTQEERKKSHRSTNKHGSEREEHKSLKVMQYQERHPRLGRAESQSNDNSRQRKEKKRHAAHSDHQGTDRWGQNKRKTTSRERTSWQSAGKKTEKQKFWQK